jgi:hypothetical protein
MKIKSILNNKSDLLYYPYYNTRLKEFFFDTLALKDASMIDNYPEGVTVININFTRSSNIVQIYFILEDQDENLSGLAKQVSLLEWEKLNNDWNIIVSKDDLLSKFNLSLPKSDS